MFRTLKVARRRHDYDIPDGTTHVVSFTPSWLLDPRPADPAEGLWELDTLDDFLAGTPSGMGGWPGAASGVPFDASAWFGGRLRLVRFELEVSDDSRAETVPAYWITPAA